MNRTLWIAVSLLLAGLFIYLTKGVLLPFLAGLAVAYFLDPLVDRLETLNMNRGVASALIIALFFVTLAGAIIAFWPVIQSQLAATIETLPKTLAALRPKLNALIQFLSDKLGEGMSDDVEGLLSSVSTSLFGKLQDAASSALNSSLAIFNLISLILISPVVAFYLLRDWDLLIAKIDSLLPSRAAPTIRELASSIDHVVAGFVRGQIMVSSIMGILYAVGWTLTGLKFSIILGLLAGVMSFVPFVGALFASGIALLIAFGQWGFDPAQLALVLSVFLVVQLLEGSFLTPKLVGERVGLHPVWVLFAVLAGGELMGFVGVLIAVPAAAAIAVLVRYWIERYQQQNTHFSPDKS